MVAVGDRRRLLSSPVARLGAFAVVLGVALGAGALVGATFGPDAAGEPDAMTPTSAGTATLPGGLAITADGYTLQLHTPVVAADRPATIELTIAGPDGRPVTTYDIDHDKELHLIVVSRDLARYAHVHPVRDPDGRWSVEVPAMPPGSYRVFADFTPAGGDGVTLGADLTIPGEHRPVALADPSHEASVDGYAVSFDGQLVAGTESEIAVTVTGHGEPVTDLEPYLGALGHLVAIRAGDLAYLHVHPLDGAAGAAGPSVRFVVEVPSAGAYRLFFDFSHDGTVRTAAVTADAAPAGEAAPPTGSAPASHDEHEG
jgi:hypothetical protein